MYRFGKPKSLDTITAKDVIDNKLWVWETKEMNINIKESIEEMTAALFQAIVQMKKTEKWMPIGI